jgi:hypothetical protein
MRRVISLMACITLLCVCCLAWLARAQDTPASGPLSDAKHAKRKFSDATLDDRYAFHTLALRVDQDNPTTGPSIPFAISGYYFFHGDGTLDGKDTVSMQGQILERAYNGTYHVNPDGTGTLTLNMSPDFQPEGRFVIAKGGDLIEIIFAVPRNLNAFTLHKQNAR